MTQNTAYKANPSIYYVYVYLNEDGVPFYVGKGKGKRIDCRWGRKFQIPPQNRRVKIYENITESEALDKEKKLIERIGKDNLVNKTTGGQGVSGLTFNHSEEWKTMMSNKFTGECNPFYGQRHTKITKSKMIEAAKNRSDEWRSNQRISQTIGKIYIFVCPLGKQVVIEGSLNYFCNNNNLNTGAMSQVHLGKKSHHKGWRKA